MPTEKLTRYKREFADLDGFFMPLAMATWDFLFAAQKEHNIGGGMLEIGVFQGKSALLSALYLAPDEPGFFLDLHKIPAAQEQISLVKPENAHFLTMNSVNALRDPGLAGNRGALRWIHIDGEHTGYATAVDLSTAAYLLSADGIICVDDFFSFKYPQLTASVYQFLLDNPFAFKMFLISANKCYICRSNSLQMYDDHIRNHVIEDMQLAENNWTLARTSYLHDFGCFSIIPRNKDRNFVGLDRDIKAEVF